MIAVPYVVLTLLAGVSGQYSFDTDPDLAFLLNTDPDPIRILGFDEQKFKKIHS
jgi:hypothetical protein